MKKKFSGTRTTTTNFSYFHLEVKAVIAYLASACFRAIGVLNRTRQLRISLGKYKFINFLLGVVLGIAVVVA